MNLVIISQNAILSNVVIVIVIIWFEIRVTVNCMAEVKIMIKLTV